jgi:purine nucleosidase
MPKRQILLDVDVGIDDAVMMLALAAEPDAEIVAVGSCHGNCTAAQAAINALRVLETVGLDRVPVALGAESPLAAPVHAPHVHGHDGLADVGLPLPRGTVSGESAAEQIVRLSRERPGELDLIAVGTMTNLALALERDADVLRRFRTVSILGGYARPPRPQDPATVDPNVAKSPLAAERVFASSAPLLVVPVDTSFFCTDLADEQIDRLRASTTPQGRLAWKILPFYFDVYQRRLGRWSACMHDPLVPAVLLDPSLVQATVSRPLSVEPCAEGHRAVARGGDELADQPRRDAARIVTAVDQRRFLDRLVDALVLPLGALPPISGA